VAAPVPRFTTVRVRPRKPGLQLHLSSMGRAKGLNPLDFGLRSLIGSTPSRGVTAFIQLRSATDRCSPQWIRKVCLATASDLRGGSPLRPLLEPATQSPVIRAPTPNGYC